MLDILTMPIARIPESFIGNRNQEEIPKGKKEIRNMSQQLVQEAGRGTSAILEAKPKPIKKAKTQKAWFKQIRRIYAIDFAIYGSKTHAEQVSKCYRKSFDLAKAKITQLEETQKLKVVTK